MTVFVQLVGGLGKIPFHVEVVEAGTGEVVYRTRTNHLLFYSRLVAMHMALTIHGCPFAYAGVYLVELYCNEQFVADTRLIVHRQ